MPSFAYGNLRTRLEVLRDPKAVAKIVKKPEFKLIADEVLQVVNVCESLEEEKIPGLQIELEALQAEVENFE